MLLLMKNAPAAINANTLSFVLVRPWNAEIIPFLTPENDFCAG